MGGSAGGTGATSGGSGGGVVTAPSCRLFVVVPKVISQDVLRLVFSKYPGMERCDLKLDWGSGRSKGIAYVTFGSVPQARAAICELDGLLVTAQHRMRVMFAEAEVSRKQPPPPAPVAEAGLAESGAALPAGNKGARAGGDDGVEAVRGCFANMTMPRTTPSSSGQAEPGPRRTKVAVEARTAGGAGRRRPSGACLSDEVGGSRSAQSSGSRMRPGTPSGGGEAGEDTNSAGAVGVELDHSRLFSKLSRPLPDYALFHVFSKYGNVEFVRLQRDKRHAYVKFSTVDEASAAIDGLNGTNILGEKLKVAVADLRRDSRKRPRLGPAAAPGSARGCGAAEG